ncbi:MAG: MBL fold metallo-hydrolase, partial [Exilispira sp.]|nr:MBL fold metallo-hydrolase [Exilispira sp.]
AQLAVFDSFSAHADYSEIIDYLNNYDKKKIKNIFLVHGEKNALDSMQSHLRDANFNFSTIVTPEVNYKLEGR